jgi:hypothetical protein
MAAFLMMGCGKQMPRDVIGQGQMEDILYDYHLAAAMQNTQGSGDNVKKEAMRRFLFRKHGVTEAEFDSSMVWYTRHPEALAKIYTNLQDRFKAEGDRVQQLLASREEGMTLSLPGDTVDMWHGDAFFILQPHQPLHHMFTFSMQADSNFQANDAIRWTAQYAFRNDAKSVARMGLSIVYDNDSVAGEVKNVTRSGLKEIYLPQDSAYKIRSINGFIYVPAEGPMNSDILVHDMQLMRYHVPFDSTKLQKAKVDTTATAVPDSALQLKTTADTVAVSAHPQRLSPNELKRIPNHNHKPNPNKNLTPNRKPLKR